MTEAMPFLQKAILLSYDPRPLLRRYFLNDLRHYIRDRYSSLISSTLVSRGLPGRQASA